MRGPEMETEPPHFPMDEVLKIGIQKPYRLGGFWCTLADNGCKNRLRF